VSKGQIIALRFAPDEELSSLVWQVAEGNLSKPVEIKKAIKIGARIRCGFETV